MGIKYFAGNENMQAKAVLAMLEDMTIEDSYSDNDYSCDFEVMPYRNGRERGYTVRMINKKQPMKPLNIAFFEHRNSDRIHAIVQEGNSTNPPTYDFFESYTDKHTTAFSVDWGQILEMSEWICQTFNDYYSNFIENKA